VIVEIGAPLPVAGYTIDDRDRLCAEAYEAVQHCRMRARQQLAARGVESNA
jgi:hypothetical protein